MIVSIIGVFSFFAMLVILPGWLCARRTQFQTAWLLALPAVGIATWVGLAALNIGGQSMGNLIELFGVMAAAIVMAYVHLFGFSRVPKLRAWGSTIALAMVVLLAVGCRLLVPELPE